jgi:hypothetical protein
MNRSKKTNKNSKDPKISAEPMDSIDPKADEAEKEVHQDPFSKFMLWACQLDWYLYGIGTIIILVMLLISYFFEVRFRISSGTFFTGFVIIQSFALPVWITLRLYSFLYHIELPRGTYRNSTFKGTFLGSAALILFLGTTEIPAALTKIIAPIVCPAGFEEITYMGGIDVNPRRGSFSSDWRYLTSESRSQTCNGELGQYAPKRYTFLLSGITLLLIYGSLFLLVAWSVTRLNYFKLYRFVALVVTFGVFIPLVFLTMLNGPLMSFVFKPINKMIYPGHAVSLVEAVRKHNITMIQRLLADGGDILAVNAKNESAFSLAHNLDDKELLALFAGQITGEPEPKKALLNQGIIYDTKNFFEQVKNNRIENVKLFLSSGFDINTLQDGSTALTIAAQNGNKELVQSLLEHKADINKSGLNSWAPLQAAAASGQSEIFLMLARAGADLEEQGLQGETLLMLASKAQCLPIVKYLIENKAAIDALSSSGQTALLFAIEYAAKEEVPDPNHKNYKMERMAPNSYDLVKYLLEKGADPSSNIYRTGKTPLSRAKFKRIPELIKLLQSYHARE